MIAKNQTPRDMIIHAIPGFADQTVDSLLYCSSIDYSKRSERSLNKFAANKEYLARSILQSDKKLINLFQNIEDVTMLFIILYSGFLILALTVILIGGLLLTRLISTADNINSCIELFVQSCERYSEIIDLQTSILTNDLIQKYYLGFYTK